MTITGAESITRALAVDQHDLADHTRRSGDARPTGGGPEDELMEAARAVEGVFFHYFVKALRSTVPNGGSPDAPGADMYGSLLDEHLAQVAADDMGLGLAEVLYRQLSQRSEPSPPEVGADP